jgi:hypothetical protein
MAKDAAIGSACPGANYTKPVIEADLETEFWIQCLNEDDCRDLGCWDRSPLGASLGDGPVGF